MAVRLPRSACIYKEMYRWVDRTNQDLAYYNSDRRTVRKQNRVLESLIETYALNNGHCVWQNSPNLIANVSRDDRSISEFRFKVIRAWYASCRMYNSKQNCYASQINPRTGEEKQNMSCCHQEEGGTIRYASPLLMRLAKRAGLNAECVVKKLHKNVRNVLDWGIQLHSAMQELTIDNAGITSMAAENTIF